MKTDKYLPIGTVVLLKDAKKRVMITGFCTQPVEKPDKIYDYSGCLFPEGIMKTDEILLFDHNQISKIYHFGLSDEEEKKFKQDLEKALEEEKSKKE